MNRRQDRQTRAHGPRPQVPPSTATTSIALVVISVAVVIAGCGGTSPAVAHESTTPVLAPPVAGAFERAAVTGAIAPLAEPWAADGDDRRVHALLVNGGGEPKINFLSHVEHLLGMREALLERGVDPSDVTLLTADGLGQSLDLTIRDERTDLNDIWLLEGTAVDSALAPRSERRDAHYGDASTSVLAADRATVDETFEQAAETAQPGDLVFIYVTDHGIENERDPDNGAIALWHDILTVRAWQTMLDAFDPDVRIVFVMSQCFSGTFAASVLGDSASTPDGQRCGFFSVPRDRPAYGCYPEGRGKGEGKGHGYVFIEHARTHPSLDGAHVATLVDDDTPDAPLRTSDIYLEQVLVDRLGSPLGRHASEIDGLLERGADDPAWATVAALARAYGVDSVDSYGDLLALERDVNALFEAYDAASEQWKAALVELARAHLDAFIEANPAWAGIANELAGMDDPAPRVAELLDAVRAWSESRDDGAVLDDLEMMHDRWKDARAARWRALVRVGALERIRTVLVGIAARSLFADAPEALADAHSAWQALRTCESTQLGERDDAARVQAALEARDLSQVPRRHLARSHDEDVERLARLRPTRLGVRYASAAGHPDGVVVLRGVAPESAAARAGLRTGDLVLGPPDDPFAFPDDIRRWTLTAPVGEPITLEIERDGRRATVNVELGVAEPDAR